MNNPKSNNSSSNKAHSKTPMLAAKHTRWKILPFSTLLRDILGRGEEDKKVLKMTFHSSIRLAWWMLLSRLSGGGGQGDKIYASLFSP